MNEKGITAIGRQLPLARNLKKISINNDKETLQQANFTTFIEGIIDSNVTELQLCDNGIPDLEAAEIGRLLAQSKLESLSLDGNGLGVWAARAISDYLSQPGARLQTLKLSRNRLISNDESTK
ncbi:hypothetical protein BVRB_022840 [Beta vulgaris subsp. vulgaris]|uniref:Uncharacterized protein n=1 Tax=Beta vulgaris subsp. vulgaris TaxID=3555 RepID=A0A0J8DU14_BETVV|nr:hypothetical protein BVRB_022840 [Beta vulgaris subsp. vulgaris]